MRELFLLDPDIVFLNHGSFGACPRPVFEAYQACQLELERRPVEFLGRRSAELLASARARLAGHVGATPDDLVFIPNTTTGVNTVARSLALEPGDEVLATDQEYGACDNVWELVCSRAGARYVRRELPLPLPGPGEVAEAIWSGVTPATRVLYLSHITSTTALILPVADLCRRARAAGILSVIDGAHVPGQLELDLEAVGADVYVANCHKWLCAPKGAALLHVRPERQLDFDAAVVSWGYSTRVEGHTSFDGYLGTTPFVRRHQWQGTRDISAFLSVPAAIDFQREHGWEEVRRRCHAMALDLRDRVGALTGLSSVCGDDAFGQMVPVPLPPCEPEALKATLYDRFHIEVPVTAHRGRHLLRVSLQGYNTPADVDALVEAVRVLLSEPSGPFAATTTTVRPRATPGSCSSRCHRAGAPGHHQRGNGTRRRAIAAV
jgi:isopenicillin-N epimerase